MTWCVKGDVGRGQKPRVMLKSAKATSNIHRIPTASWVSTQTMDGRMGNGLGLHLRFVVSVSSSLLQARKLYRMLPCRCPLFHVGEKLLHGASCSVARHEVDSCLRYG